MGDAHVQASPENSTVWPGNFGGYCQLHHLPLPCQSCSTALPIQPYTPNVQPYTPPVIPVANPDPWMHYTPGPTPKAGYGFLPSVCDHCFCQDGKDCFGSPLEDHEGCCNCGIQRKRADEAVS